jgi:hypothetical protein
MRTTSSDRRAAVAALSLIRLHGRSMLQRVARQPALVAPVHRCSLTRVERCLVAPGATFKAVVRLSANIHRTPVEDIMIDHAPQGTSIDAAVLAHLQMDLYTPPYQANEHEAETFRASQYATTQGRR